MGRDGENLCGARHIVKKCLGMISTCQASRALIGLLETLCPVIHVY